MNEGLCETCEYGLTYSREYIATYNGSEVKETATFCKLLCDRFPGVTECTDYVENEEKC